jgi:hypothetical protein
MHDTIQMKKSHKVRGSIRYLHRNVQNDYMQGTGTRSRWEFENIHREPNGVVKTHRIVCLRTESAVVVRLV